MNNLISFWLAPVTAFFHPRVYRDAVKNSGSRGVLYSLYLSGWVTLVAMMMFSIVFVGAADQFSGWLQKEMPVLVWTPDGLSLEANVKQPYTLVHPAYGPLVTFDMAKTGVTEAEMGKYPIFVTSKKMFVKKAPGQIEERDITQAGFQAQGKPQQRLPPKVRITGEVVKQLYQNIKKALFVALPIVFVLAFFIFFLVSGLFYSLIGLLFNRMRKEKLRYGAIFNLACFALTASFILGWVLRSFSTFWFVGFLINLGYLFFAFKVTDPEKK